MVEPDIALSALSSVKYRFDEPSVRSSVSESATPFSAVIVRPAPVPVIVIFVRFAPVSYTHLTLPTKRIV